MNPNYMPPPFYYDPLAIFMSYLRFGVKMFFFLMLLLTLLYLIQPWFVVRVTLRNGDWELGVHKAGVMLQNNSEIIEHVVRPNETLRGIAKAYGVTPSDLQQWNGIKNTDVLNAGQHLVIWRPAT
jgi:hypothetical protein